MSNNKSDHDSDKRNPADYTPSDWGKLGVWDNGEFLCFDKIKDYNLYKKVITKHYLEEGYKKFNGWELVKETELKKGDIIEVEKLERGYKFGEVVRITNQYIYFNRIHGGRGVMRCIDFRERGLTFLYTVCRGEGRGIGKIERNKKIYKTHPNTDKFIYEYNTN